MTTKQEAVKLIEKYIGDVRESECNKLVDALEQSDYCSQSVKALVKKMQDYLNQYFSDAMAFQPYTESERKLLEKILGK